MQCELIDCDLLKWVSYCIEFMQKCICILMYIVFNYLLSKGCVKSMFIILFDIIRYLIIICDRT